MSSFLDGKFRRLLSEFTRYKNSGVPTDRPNWIPKPDTEDEVLKEEEETWQQRFDRRQKEMSRLTWAVAIIGFGALFTEPREFRSGAWVACNYTVGWVVDWCPDNLFANLPNGSVSSSPNSEEWKAAYQSGFRDGMRQTKRPLQFVQIIDSSGLKHFVSPYRPFPMQGQRR